MQASRWAAVARSFVRALNARLILGIQLEGLLCVVTTLFGVVFRIPIDRQIAIGEGERIRVDRLFHQMETGFEIALVNSDLAKTVKSDRL